MSLSFKGKIEIIGVNPYVLVSAEQASQLQPIGRGPIPVIIQVNGKPDVPWHINMVPAGDTSYYLYLHGDVRKASGTKVGDVVEVVVDFDTDYHNGPLTALPEWFSRALESNEAATHNWVSLSPSRQKEIVRYLVNLKSQEAKDRNLVKVIEMLSGTNGHYMGRDWVDGK
jgi:hypothetical protein